MKDLKKEKKIDPELSRDDDYSLGTPRKTGVIAYIVCVIAAVLIWLVIMNLDQPVNIPLSASAGGVTELVSNTVLWAK
jgi:hypothetical protein